MKTRCKMICQSFDNHGETNSVRFSPVIDGGDENKEFFKYTPAGELVLDIINPDIGFEPGKEYYVDIIACEQN